MFQKLILKNKNIKNLKKSKIQKNQKNQKAVTKNLI